MKYLLLLILVPISGKLRSQELTGVSSRWDDSYREWYLYAFLGDTEVEGELKLRWWNSDNWQEWEYRLGEDFGDIRQKWKDNPNIWEIRGGGEVIVARTIWQNDFSQWRIENGQYTLTLESRWRNLADEWRLREERYGSFRIYTDYEGDPRDWVVEDGLDEELSIHLKIALAFIVMYHSTPKY